MLGVDWLDGYRAAAIGERLAERDATGTWPLERRAPVRRDVDPLARDPRDCARRRGRSRRMRSWALGLLRDWDGRVAPGSAAASVFELVPGRAGHDPPPARQRRSPWRWAMGAGFGDVITRTALSAPVTVGRLCRAPCVGWGPIGARPFRDDTAPARYDPLSQGTRAGSARAGGGVTFGRSACGTSWER